MSSWLTKQCFCFSFTFGVLYSQSFYGVTKLRFLLLPFVVYLYLYCGCVCHLLYISQLWKCTSYYNLLFVKRIVMVRLKTSCKLQ